ncbi:disease resistance protein RGA5 [Aegilops tauschii subsp. strangulata]|uniref:disease resistance protein RGA5 n=1 Tax=Aegilops tauschii subsp. strangulata TaxID=200361 RepID=UPI00098A9BF4|nr:disease resistance protein RGA5 [Aegilops tauschii subsp. strangulata]
MEGRYEILGEPTGRPTTRALVAVDPRLWALYPDASGLVGIDGPKEKLAEQLEKGNTQQLKVVSVVGFGGMGKTTLANQVRHKIKSQFDCTAFVSVSQIPNMATILSRTLLQVGGTLPSDSNDDRRLIDCLRDHLKNKRYLIVIDDLWTTEAWNTIRCSLVENDCGSRVITTTRIEAVAQACCSSHGSVYKIKPLNDIDSRTLFHRRIFHPEDACPEELKSVSDEILMKYVGVPLAILSVASILASPEGVKSKETWEKVKNYLGFQLEGNPALGLMKHVLNLSYSELSPDLKTCMLYLGLFPEDGEISKDDLVKRWVVEGFLTEDYGPYGPEEIAESHFNELINRNMIQIGKLDDCGHVLSCRVHDLMLDFIIVKSTDENFITIINDVHNTKKGHLEARRLSLQVKNSEYCQVLADMDLAKARSCNFWGPCELVPPLSRFQLLRVLSLHIDHRHHYCSRGNQQQCDLSPLRGLFQLRYLSLMSRHYFMLDAGDLPSTLWHLIVPPNVTVSEIRRMKALRTLDMYEIFLHDRQRYEQHIHGTTITDVCREIKHEANIKGLGKLTDLRELTLCRGSYGVGDTLDLLLSTLCMLHSLQCLTIHGHGMHEDALTWYLWSSPPRHLRRLHVLPWPFSTVPDWISQLDKLTSLEAELDSLSTDGAEILGKLTSLVHLRLHVREERAPNEGVFIRRAMFPNLKSFCFRHQVPCLVFEAGAIPLLQRLTVDCYMKAVRQSDGVLDGIEHLGRLKSCKVDIYRQHRFIRFYADSSRKTITGVLHRQPHLSEVPRWDFRSLKGAFREAINNRPGCPDVSIQDA